MFSNIPLEKILQITKRYGAEYSDVFVEQSRETRIIMDNRKLERASLSNELGVGIRMLINGHCFYGSTNDLTKKNLLNLARDIGRTAEVKKKVAKPITLSETQAKTVTLVRQHPVGTAPEEKCAVVTRANDVAWLKGKEIRQVRVVYRDTIRKISIACSEGLLAGDEQVNIVFAVQVVAGDGKVLQTGYEPIGGSVGFEIFEGTPPEEVAERAAESAIRALHARNAPAGQMPVVLSAEAGGTMIHEAVGHGLEGDLAGEGLSVYSGRLGEKVASEKVSVADNATLAGKRGSFSFDDEGTNAKNTLLIEKGVLKAYLSNQLTLMKYNYPLTGNGRRQNYAHSPIVRMTNTLILPGTDDPAGILRETFSGLFVKKMGGGQVNTINGDFVFDVQEGYLIEDGKLGDPVRGALLIGNGPKVLSAIDRVGSDLGFSIGTCGKDGQEAPVSCGQPTIRIPEITVGGRR